MLIYARKNAALKILNGLTISPYSFVRVPEKGGTNNKKTIIKNI